MKYLMHIESMRCVHCAAKVEKALSALGLTAKVDLDSKTCLVEGIADETAMKEAVEAKGFPVVGIDKL